MDVREYRLGVDFGTSNTVAVLGYPDGHVRPLLFDGSPALPSAVFLDPAAGFLVGRDAEHAARTGPDRFEPNPKRRIDEHAVLLGGTEVAVVDLIAAVLGRVAGEARRVAGRPVPVATLTYPAAWAQTRRRMLVMAAERVGLTSVTLVPEPVAAASSFVAAAGSTVPPGASVVVYDLGAGTFDASVVRRGPGGFEVAASEGLSQAGGLDIDAAIVAYLGAVYSTRIADVWQRLLRPTTAEERRANRLLWDDVRAAKETLSRTARTTVHIPLADEDAPLGRDQFEQLARPLLDATVTATRAALNTARVAPSAVAGVFLVGGGSRIPLAATLLHQALGRAPTITEQPELVVAEGSLRTVGTLAPAHAAPPPPRPTSAPPMPPRPPRVTPPPSPANQPVSGTPWPVSAPPPGASAVSAPPWSPPPAAPWQHQRPPPPRRGRGRGSGSGVLVAVGLVVVLVLAAGAFTVFKLVSNRSGGGDSGGTGSATQAPDPGVRTVNRTMFQDVSFNTTLTSIEVLQTGKIKVNIRYRNDATVAWPLTCPAADADLQSSFLTIPGRRNVFTDNTWCTSQQRPGQTFGLQPGATLDSWGTFPTVPGRGVRFSLNWYNLPAVTGLVL